MFKRFLALWAFLVAVTGAEAGDVSIWKEDVQGWNVAVDRTIRNSCFIIGQFDQDTLLRLQFNAADPGVQLIFANMGWKSLVEGTVLPMSFAMNGQTPWVGDATVRYWNGVLPSLVLSAELDAARAAEFVAEFSAGGHLSLSQNGAELVGLTVSGTQAAVREMMACQAEMDAHVTRES